MRRTIRVSLAAGVSVLALAGAGFQAANAADVAVAQYQAPPPAAYAPPPVRESYVYPPPAPVYAYPPPPPPVAYYYGPRPYVAWPYAYYGPGPYWHRGPHFAYGYGHWGHWHR